MEIIVDDDVWRRGTDCVPSDLVLSYETNPTLQPLEKCA
jgi:hypothetical protein